MATRVALTGNDAAAEALRQSNPDVAAVFPITPQTELMHKFSQFVADGDVDTELVHVESEHSAMSACVGAAAAGARVVTATSANGLALMWEIVYIAASLRLPIVMPEVNRALSGPINIHCDHSDTMGCRDSGWIQIYSENAQEAYDNVLQAFRISEHRDVLLPTMATLDGFILSHTVESLEVEDDKIAKDFIGEYKPARSLLDTDNPMTMGPLDLQDYYFEHKRQQVLAMENARGIILDVGAEYGNLTGRSYGYFEEIETDGADVILVAMGSAAGTAKAAIRQLRAEGVKAGLLKLRVFRPFPGKEVLEVLNKAKAVAVMDRAISFGLEGGPLFNEIRSFAYEYANKGLMLKSFIYGLGGRDINVGEIQAIAKNMLDNKDKDTVDARVEYIGVRE